MAKYKRTYIELAEKAVLHWPEDILQEAGDISILPLLLKTRDSFLSLLKIADKSPDAWLEILKHNTDLTGPLFIKHLMVMCDLGGEALNKYPPLSDYFPDGVMRYYWQEQDWEYHFQAIHKKCTLTNSALKVDGKRLISGEGELSPKLIDVAYLLLFGSTSVGDTLPDEFKDSCVIGSLLGQTDALDDYSKERYICVSSQLRGAKANSLGHFAEDYVVKKLTAYLPEGWNIYTDISLPNVSHSIEGQGTNFDVVVKSLDGKYAGIEISFQVTTNSTIERKAREADSLLKNVHAAGHKICYVIDGAGNIKIRKNATSLICNNSDCTIAMSEPEIQHLAQFLIEELSD